MCMHVSMELENPFLVQTTIVNLLRANIVTVSLIVVFPWHFVMWSMFATGLSGCI